MSIKKITIALIAVLFCNLNYGSEVSLKKRKLPLPTLHGSSSFPSSHSALSAQLNTPENLSENEALKRECYRLQLILAQYAEQEASFQKKLQQKVDCTSCLSGLLAFVCSTALTVFCFLPSCEKKT